MLSQIFFSTIYVYDFFGSEDALTNINKQKEMMSNLKKGKLYVGQGYNHFAVVENPTYVYNAMKTMAIEDEQ